MAGNRFAFSISGSLLVFLLIIFSCLTGCSGSTPSPAPSQAPAPGTAAGSPGVATAAAINSPVVVPSAAEPAKSIVLKFASQVQPMSSVGRVNKQWADKVKQDSGGRLEIQLYLTESLVKATEMYKAIQGGITDIGYSTVGQDASQTPLGTVTRLPFIGIPSQTSAASIQWDLLNKFPEMQNEWKGMKVAGLASLPGDQLQMVKKEVRVPADLKGLKIIARGDWPEVFQNLGAAPIGLNVGDWYSSLEKGLAEGQIINFAAANAFKTLDLLKYHTMFGDGGCSATLQIYLINSASWGKLPADLQKILADSIKWQCEETGKIDMGDQDGIINNLKTAKHNFTYLTPAEIAPWIDAARSVHQSWIKNNTANGLPAQAIYDETLSLIKQYSK
jgi:TRAP-type transport system periplasmic protein